MSKTAPAAPRDESAVATLTELAGKHAAAADSTGTLAPVVIDALRSAGFARHFVPARWGGDEGSFANLTRAVLAVAEACPSTGWLASLAASSGRCASHLPPDGQADIWSAGPDVLIATGLVSSGRAVPERDGWRVSGRWGYVSGIESADWALVSAAVGDDAAGARFFALPRGQFEIERTWDNLGMRGTGSHTVAADVVVPEFRSFPRAALMAGQNAQSAAPCHTVPFRAVGGLTFAAPIAGAASGALRAAARLLAARRRAPSADLALVRSCSRIDVARLLVERASAAADARTVAPGTAARCQRDAAFAAEQAAEAAHDLIRAAGTAGLSGTEPVQRFWRDVTSMASHVALRLETSSVQTSLPLILARG